jgi:hypothetical protein
MKKRGSSTSPILSDYDVGYMKPPKDHQFKPGRSPNPNGRPKGAKNKAPYPDELAQIIEEEGARLMAIKENGKETSMPTARVIIRKMNRQAAGGDTRAQKNSIDVLTIAQEKRKKTKADFFALAVEHKMFWQKWLSDRGTSARLPPGCPHPDSLILNFATQEVTCVSLDPDGDELISLTLDLLYFYMTMMSDLLKGETSDKDLRYVFDDLLIIWKRMAAIFKSLDLPWNDDFRGKVDDDRIKALKDKFFRKK